MLIVSLILIFAILLTCPIVTSAPTQEVTIAGDHGKLSAIIQRPANKSKYPFVIICHGFTASKEHNLLKNLADDLEKVGIASIRFDFNGHGQSEGRFQDMTVLNEIEDAKKVYEYVSKLPEVTSISIAGHSQGGVVTSMVAGQLGNDKIKAVALLAPAAVLREDAIRGMLQGTTYDPINTPEYIVVKSPHGEFHVGRQYIKIAQTLPIYETAMGFQGAACMIHGTGDVIVPYTYSLRYAHTYADSELHLLPNFDHGFTQDVAKAAQIAADFFAKKLK